jgi:hypothetical protein
MIEWSQATIGIGSGGFFAVLESPSTQGGEDGIGEGPF